MLMVIVLNEFIIVYLFKKYIRYTSRFTHQALNCGVVDMHIKKTK